MQALLRGELIQQRRSSFVQRWEPVLGVALAALLIFPAVFALAAMPTAPAF